MWWSALSSPFCFLCVFFNLNILQLVCFKLKISIVIWKAIFSGGFWFTISQSSRRHRALNLVAVVNGFISNFLKLILPRDKKSLLEGGQTFCSTIHIYVLGLFDRLYVINRSINILFLFA